MRKNNLSKRCLPALVIFAALCCTAALLTGALLSGDEEAAARGVILPEDVVLQDDHYLIPQKNGGYVLLSGNEVETNLTFLTREGALANENPRYLTLPYLVERIFVCGDILYAAGENYDTMSDKTAGITKVPLDGVYFSGVEIYTFDNADIQINIKSLCADLQGNMYAVEGSQNRVVRFQPESVEERTALSLPLEDTAVLDGMSAVEDTVYLSGHDENGALLWRGTLEDGDITGVTMLSGTGPQFPLAFLSETCLLDDGGRLFLLTGTGFSLANERLFRCCAVDGDGNLIGGAEDGKVDFFPRGNYDTPAASCLADGTVTAIVCDSETVILTVDGGICRFIRLRDTDFSVNSGSVSSSDGKGESASSGADIPIHSEPAGESGMAPSESGGSGTGSPNENSAGTLPMADHITSDAFSIEDGVLFLPAGTTVAQFRSTVPLHGATLSAYQYNGAPYPSGRLGTGMTLRLYHGGELLDTVTVVVRCDLNGNGAVNSADERLLYQHLTEEALLESCFYDAADVDADGVVDTRDLLLLKRQLSN